MAKTEVQLMDLPCVKGVFVEPENPTPIVFVNKQDLATWEKSILSATIGSYRVRLKP